MRSFSLTHLSDITLTRGLCVAVADHRTKTATLLAHLAEFESRKLYVPAGYDSMRAYCVGALHFCEEAASKRIRAVRAAREFPVIFEMVADGRLHLTAVVTLASTLVPFSGPPLSAESAADVLSASAHKSRFEIECLLAARSPRPDVPSRIAAIPSGAIVMQLSPGTVAPNSTSDNLAGPGGLSPGTVEASGPPPVDVAPTHGGQAVLVGRPPFLRATPLSPGRYKLEGTIDDDFRELVGHAQELEGLPAGPGGVIEALRRALRARVAQLEKRKFAATIKPRPRQPRASQDPRRIPADTRRAVAKRDNRQCTYFGNDGHRCESRAVQFDHIVPVARGGESTVANLRLRCHAHNQFAADQVFGVPFMRAKRDRARRKAERMRETARARATAALVQVSAAVDRAQEDARHGSP